jgi:hypothetical protein
VWGRLSEARAKAIMPALSDWVHGGGPGDSNATPPPATGGGAGRRCFYRSTTANYKSVLHEYFQHELRNVRGHAYSAGCSYLDYAYLTESFAALDSNDRHSTERKLVFIDSVRRRTRSRGVGCYSSSSSCRAVSPTLPTGSLHDLLASSLCFVLPQVHFQPWVYEELNQALLNVLCNNHSEEEVEVA